MSKCSRCRQRKGRRLCPALGTDLCSPCCGRLRNRDIICQPDCAYLARHLPYQQQRTMEREEEEFLKDERLVFLAFQVEAVLGAFAEKSPSFADGEALRALEYARDKTIESHRLVLVPGRAAGPRDEAGEAVYQSLEQPRRENTIIISAAGAGGTKEEKLKVLNRLILAVRSATTRLPDGRAFLDRLLERHRGAEDRSRGERIITPS